MRSSEELWTKGKSKKIQFEFKQENINKKGEDGLQIQFSFKAM